MCPSVQRMSISRANICDDPWVGNSDDIEQPRPATLNVSTEMYADPCKEDEQGRQNGTQAVDPESWLNNLFLIPLEQRNSKQSGKKCGGQECHGHDSNRLNCSSIAMNRFSQRAAGLCKLKSGNRIFMIHRVKKLHTCR